MSSELTLGWLHVHPDACAPRMHYYLFRTTLSSGHFTSIRAPPGVEKEGPENPPGWCRACVDADGVDHGFAAGWDGVR
eukprot:1267310-Amorphochlora_amoeboformis.AAC.1